MDATRNVFARFAFCLFALALCTATPAAATVRFQTPVLAQIGRGTDPANYGRFNIAFGDLNGDGLVDAVCPLSDSLGIYFGHGDGSFAPPLFVASPGRGDRPAIADFDGDGAIDIAYGGIHQVAILYGNGSGTAWTFQSLATAHSWYSVLAGDFDGDGRVDLLTTSIDASNAQWLTTFLGRPGHTFETHAEIQNAIYYDPQSLHASDVNGDGRADVVLGPGASKAQVWTSDGDGTFTQTTSVPSSYGVWVGDLTGDGHPDIVTAYSGFAVSLYAGRGDGTFGVERQLNFYPRSGIVDVAIGDLNGDGIADLTLVSSYGTVSTALGTGAGAFAAAQPFSAGPVWYPVRVVDLDGDGRLDFVGLTRDALVSALGDGAGGVRRPATAIAGNAPAGAACADMNGDGIADLALLYGSGASAYVQVVLGATGRALAPLAPVALANALYTPQVADYDEDGVPDLLVMLTGSRVALLHGRGDGTLDTARVLAPSADGVFTTACDVTADGHLDLVYVAASTVRVFPGDGTGAFGGAISTVLSTDSPVTPLVVADFDGDGKADVVAAFTCCSSSYSPYEVFRYRGDGSGAFAPGALVYSTSWGTSLRIAAGDVDGDGIADLVTNEDNYCTYCSMTGWLKTWPHAAGNSTASQSSRYGGVDLVDVDADGKLDAHLASAAGPIIAFGDGAGRFGAYEGYGGGTSGTLFGDLDGDGLRDLITWPNPVTQTGIAIAYGLDSQPPAVTVFGPTPGAAFGEGAHADIEWTATDNARVSSIDLSVSRHGNDGPFETIATAQPNTGRYTWPVTGPASDSVVFKVVARDAADNVAWAVSAPFTTISDVLGVADASAMPLSIRWVRPNPSHGALRLAYTLPHRGRVRISLIDLSGRCVAVLVDGVMPAGRSEFDTDMTGLANTPSPGVYFVRCTMDGRSAVTRVTLLR